MKFCGKNMGFSLPNHLEYGLNENGPSGITSAIPTLDIVEPVEEVQAMPYLAHYLDSARLRKTEHQPNIAPMMPAKWQSIGDLARALAAKAEGRAK